MSSIYLDCARLAYWEAEHHAKDGTFHAYQKKLYEALECMQLSYQYSPDFVENAYEEMFY